MDRRREALYVAHATREGRAASCEGHDHLHGVYGGVFFLLFHKTDCLTVPQVLLSSWSAAVITLRERLAAERAPVMLLARVGPFVPENLGLVGEHKRDTEITRAGPGFVDGSPA